MAVQAFSPFYERLVGGLPGHSMRILVPILLGLTFLLVHYLVTGNTTFEDWSWFVAVLVGLAMYCVYYATDTVRELGSEIEGHAGAQSSGVYENAVARVLSDKMFIVVGLFFGLLNATFGWLFGISYHDVLPTITILLGYFAVGFICGLALLGIYAVVVSIDDFAQAARDSFDFASPDRCGGVAYVGDALVVFGVVTLTTGIAISIYLFRAHWVNSGVPWIRWLQYCWIAFPYAASLLVLVGPAVPIHRALRQYRLAEDISLQRRIADIRRQIENGHNGAADLKELRETFQYFQVIHKQLYEMRTWPFDVDARLRVLAAIGANVAVSLHTVSGWVSAHP